MFELKDNGNDTRTATKNNHVEAVLGRNADGIKLDLMKVKSTIYAIKSIEEREFGSEKGYSVSASKTLVDIRTQLNTIVELIDKDMKFMEMVEKGLSSLLEYEQAKEEYKAKYYNNSSETESN